MPILVFQFAKPVVFLTHNPEEVILQLFGLLKQKNASYAIVNDGGAYQFIIEQSDPFIIEALGSMARLTIPDQFVAEMIQGGYQIETNVQMVKDNMFHFIEVPASRRVAALIYTADQGFAAGFARLHPPTKQTLH